METSHPSVSPEACWVREFVHFTLTDEDLASLSLRVDGWSLRPIAAGDESAPLDGVDLGGVHLRHGGFVSRQELATWARIGWCVAEWVDGRERLAYEVDFPIDGGGPSGIAVRDSGCR